MFINIPWQQTHRYEGVAGATPSQEVEVGSGFSLRVPSPSWADSILLRKCFWGTREHPFLNAGAECICFLGKGSWL